MRMDRHPTCWDWNVAKFILFGTVGLNRTDPRTQNRHRHILTSCDTVAYAAELKSRKSNPNWQEPNVA